MIEVVDLVGRDDGADTALRVLPCTKRTWCMLHRDHDGSCVEIPRREHERPEWDRRTPDPKGWRKPR